MFKCKKCHIFASVGVIIEWLYEMHGATVKIKKHGLNFTNRNTTRSARNSEQRTVNKLVQVFNITISRAPKRLPPPPPPPPTYLNSNNNKYHG